MKQAELLKHSQCSICRNKILHTGLPLLWRVTVERFGVDLKAVRRQDGLSALIGSPEIAAVMGPDEDMAKLLLGPITLAICEQCALHHETPIGVVALDLSAQQGEPT